MARPMKVLVAYDGSGASSAALEDLTRAGLPRAGDMTILSAADVWLPAGEGPLDRKKAEAFPGLVSARERASKAFAATREMALETAVRAAKLFPAWRVRGEGVTDSPAWAIIKKTRAWGADLVVVGTHNKTAWSGLALGSVSQKVLAESPCSVRIARPRPAGRTGALRLLVAMDGSPHARAAVDTVLRRTWPRDTEVRLAAAVDDRLLTAAAVRITPLKEWARRGDTSEDAWVERMLRVTAKEFQEKGLGASVTLERADPKTFLGEEAQRWGADALFIGARGVTKWEKFVLGSVSTALAVRAPCTVEVVRL